MWREALHLSPYLTGWLEEQFDLVERRGVPPQVFWITCENTSNAALKKIFVETLDEALDLLKRGEPLVEISDAAYPP